MSQELVISGREKNYASVELVSAGVKTFNTTEVIKGVENVAGQHNSEVFPGIDSV